MATLTARPPGPTAKGVDTAPSETTLPQPQTKPPLPKAEGRTINVRANERMLFFLSKLKNEFGVSMSDSLRKGVGLFFMAKQEEKKGRRLAFVDENNNVVVEVQPL